MDNVWLYVTQILLVISSIGIALANNKKKIYYINLAFNALCLAMYILQGNAESGAVYAVITIRSILYAFHKNESDKYIPIACTISQLAVGIVGFDEAWHIIPVVAPTLSCIYLWYCKDLQTMRLWNILNHTLWLIYNLHCGLYLAVLSRFIIIISNITIYMKNRK